MLAQYYTDLLSDGFEVPGAHGACWARAVWTDWAVLPEHGVLALTTKRRGAAELRRWAAFLTLFPPWPGLFTIYLDCLFIKNEFVGIFISDLRLRRGWG